MNSYGTPGLLHVNHTLGISESYHWWVSH